MSTFVVQNGYKFILSVNICALKKEWRLTGKIAYNWIWSTAGNIKIMKMENRLCKVNKKFLVDCACFHPNASIYMVRLVAAVMSKLIYIYNLLVHFCEQFLPVQIQPSLNLSRPCYHHICNVNIHKRNFHTEFLGTFIIYLHKTNSHA
jgi:hypothetical protein